MDLCIPEKGTQDLQRCGIDTLDVGRIEHDWLACLQGGL